MTFRRFDQRERPHRHRHTHRTSRARAYPVLLRSGPYYLSSEGTCAFCRNVKISHQTCFQTSSKSLDEVLDWWHYYDDNANVSRRCRLRFQKLIVPLELSIRQNPSPCNSQPHLADLYTICSKAHNSWSNTQAIACRYLQRSCYLHRQCYRCSNPASSTEQYRRCNVHYFRTSSSN